MSTACAPTDQLLQTLKVMVPGATDELISLQLWNVIDEFLRRTSAWKHMQDIELMENELTYGLALPADSAVVRVMGVSHNNVPVPAASASGSGATYNAVGVLVPEQTFPDGDASFLPVELGPPLGASGFSYAIYRPEYITVTGAPDAEMRKYPLQVVFALSISKGCLQCECGDWQLEEWMYEMFFQDWLDGTASRLFGMLAKPWTNKELMVYHGKRFRSAMGFRKQEAPRGFVHNVPGWRFPRTGGWT